MSDTNIIDLPAATQSHDASPLAEPPELIYCMSCKHWQPSAPVRPAMHSAFGQCLLSGKALPAPIYTTDLSTCSMAVRMG